MVTIFDCTNGEQDSYEDKQESNKP